MDCLENLSNICCLIGWKLDPQLSDCFFSFQNDVLLRLEIFGEPIRIVDYVIFNQSKRDSNAIQNDNMFFCLVFDSNVTSLSNRVT